MSGLYPDKLAWTRAKQIYSDRGFASQRLIREDHKGYFDLFLTYDFSGEPIK